MAGDWTVVEFSEVLVNGTRNGVYKPKEFHGSGVKIVNMGELFAYPRLHDVPMNRIELADNELEKASLQPGDLLFARRSLVAEGAGKCSIVMELTEPTTFESSIIRARPDRAKAHSLFLYYFFNSPQGRYSLGTILRQVAVSGITGTDLVRLRIPLPGLKEQQAMACILGALDDKIELNQRMDRTLEATARALFKSWFVDFDPVRAKAAGEQPPDLPRQIIDLFPGTFEDSKLGATPKGWHAGTLADFADLNPESWSKSTAPDQIEYVDLANTKWGRIESIATYLWKSAPSRAQRVLRPADTIVGTVRPGNGSYALISDEGLTGSTGFAVLRPRRAEFEQFVYLGATSTENIERLAHLADGAAYPAVRPEVVSASPVVRPTDAVIQQFSRTARPLMSKIAVNTQQSRTLSDIRDVLLPKLISGDMRVSDAQRIVERCA